MKPMGIIYLSIPMDWKCNGSGYTTNQWDFCPYEERMGELSTGSPLVTIKSFSKSEYFDDFDTKGYEKITENEKHAYYTKVQYRSNSDLLLSFEEVAANFIPISQ